MTSKAEIEAQIEALKKKLKESEMDADFTPTELVRWDPSLLGTVLHLKYYRNTHRRCVRNVVENSGSYYFHLPTEAQQAEEKKGNFTNDIEYEQLFHIGILVNEGIYIAEDEIHLTSGPFPQFIGIYNTTNTFASLSAIKMCCRITNNYPISSSSGWTKLSVDKVSEVKDEHGYARIILKLTKPDDNLLDKIHIAKVVKLPFQDKEVIIDLYPLSTLYKEWKADKDAKRPVRSGVQWHGIRPEWAGDEVITWRTKSNMQGSRYYHSAPTEKKVDEHVPACDCTMCVVTKGHP